MGSTGVLILAAGRGKRMGTEVPKQFLELRGKALFLYSVEAYLPFADKIAVVTGKDEIARTKALLFDAGYGTKVDVIEGGKERYDSSYAGIRYLSAFPKIRNVLIHDAARPFVDGRTIRNVIDDTERYGAAVAAVISKNTIKIADSEGFVSGTPDRKNCFVIQTPQGFSLPLIRSAFEKLFEHGTDDVNITDDAMVAELFGNVRVKLSEGNDRNFKVTSPDDLVLAKALYEP